MDWSALSLSLQLAARTVPILLPVSILSGRFLAFQQFRGKALVEALVMLPLVVPPTVLGFHLLVALGRGSPIGQGRDCLFGRPLVFSFEGLVVASLLFHLAFAMQPAQRGFQAIPAELREAAACCGMSPWRSLWRVELPLAWPGGGDGDGADIRPHAGRVRHRADGRRLDPGRDPDHRNLRPGAGLRHRLRRDQGMSRPMLNFVE